MELKYLSKPLNLLSTMVTKDYFLTNLTAMEDNSSPKQNRLFLTGRLSPNFNKDLVPESVIEKCQEALDQNKGIFLTGPQGTGKTTLMRKFVSDHPDMKFCTPFTMCEEIAGSQRGIYDRKLSFFNQKKEIVIDNLGREDAAYWGMSKIADWISIVVNYRYEIYTTFGTLTHFTSNSLPKDIEKRYGKDILDRISEMSNIVAYTRKDGSLRIPDKSPWKPKN